MLRAHLTVSTLRVRARLPAHAEKYASTCWTKTLWRHDEMRVQTDTHTGKYASTSQHTTNQPASTCWTTTQNIMRVRIQVFQRRLRAPLHVGADVMSCEHILSCNTNWVASTIIHTTSGIASTPASSHILSCERIALQVQHGVRARAFHAAHVNLRAHSATHATSNCEHTLLHTPGQNANTPAHTTPMCVSTVRSGTHSPATVRAPKTITPIGMRHAACTLRAPKHFHTVERCEHNVCLFQPTMRARGASHTRIPANTLHGARALHLSPCELLGAQPHVSLRAHSPLPSVRSRVLRARQPPHARDVRRARCNVRAR